MDEANLMKESRLANGNLSNDCWLFMFCTTFIIDENDTNACKSWLNLSSFNYEELSNCESLFQFSMDTCVFSMTIIDQDYWKII